MTTTDHMTVIGLTGPSGAGKSTVAALFAERGLPVLDADEIYHQLLIPPSPCLEALQAEFGNDILTADGTLDRVTLGKRVFENSDAGRAALSRLNTITHRYVTERLQLLLLQHRSRGTSAVVIDAPLLIEAGIHRICSYTVCVLAPASLRLQRLMARDGRDRAAILARIQAQPDDDFYRSRTDAVIQTESNDIAVLRDRVTDILRCTEVLQ